MKPEVCDTVNIENCETIKEKECRPVKRDQCDNILEEVCKEVGGNFYSKYFSIDLGRLESLLADFLQDILTSLAKGISVRTSWRRSARRWVDLSILCL